MAKLVSAYVIYNGDSNRYVDDGTLVTINCERINAYSPRPVWLKTWLAPGDGTIINYQPTFFISSADVIEYGTNLIQGFWIEQDGKGVMVDVANINTLTSACNACCDDSPAVTLTRYYTGGITAFTYPTASVYCITRLDDGGASAHENAALAYVNQGVSGFILKTNISGVSKYRVTSSVVIVAVGTDTVAAGEC